MDNYSLSDISAVAGNGAGGNSWIFLIALFFLFGFGGFGGNRGNAATTEDLASGFNFNSLQNKGNETLAAIHSSNQNLGNAICQLGYQNSRDFAALSKDIATCCCETNRSIDRLGFEMANYSAAINANTTAGVQKILDRLSEDKIEAQAQRINNLERQIELSNVVKYPVFATTNNPFYNNCMGAI